jgi:hypothetical protein
MLYLFLFFPVTGSSYLAFVLCNQRLFPYSGFKVQTALISVLCVILLVQLSLVANLLNIFLVWFPHFSLDRFLLFFISNLYRVMNVACFLPGYPPTSVIQVPTFRNTLSIPSSWTSKYEVFAYEDGTECSETLALKLQTPVDNPE